MIPYNVPIHTGSTFKALIPGKFGVKKKEPGFGTGFSCVECGAGALFRRDCALNLLHSRVTLQWIIILFIKNLVRVSTTL